MNCSATASVNGATVLDPSIRIEPERSPPPLPPLPLAVAAAAGGDAQGEDHRGADRREPLGAVHSFSF
jgi:hypothetical protein